jgi:hypothetical protein
MRVTAVLENAGIFIFPMSLRTIPQDGVAIRVPMGRLSKGERIATSLSLLAMTGDLRLPAGNCHLPKCYIPGKSIFYLNAHISGKNIAKLP